MSAKLRNTRTAVALALGGVLVVTVGAWFLLVGPQRSKAGKLVGQIASVQQQVDERKAALRTPKADVHVRASDVFRLNRAMPDEVDMPGIILTLNRMASGHNLDFNSVTPSSVVPQTGFNVQPLTVVLQGRFTDVSSFLGDVSTLVTVQKRQLAASGRLFAVDAVEFAQPDAKDKSFPNVKATLTVDAFTFAGGTLTTPDNPAPSASPGTVAAGANP
jgi:Tfp pilus assembly protein PilO